MRTTRIFAAASIALLMLPALASADTMSDIQAKIQALLQQLSQLQAQLAELQKQTPTPVPVKPCLVFDRTLSAGSSGTDVSQLQSYLAQEGVYQGDVTGYFGPLTQAAVQSWQSQNGLVSGGDANTTGWGVFGSRSRDLIARACPTPPTVTPPIACTMQYLVCPTGSHRVTGPGACEQRCEPDTPSSSAAPTVTGIEGPASLAVAQSGTWTVRASVASNADQNLSYSVIWGDEGVFDQLSAFASLQGGAVQTQGTFTHSYGKAGTYKPVFTVSNSAGSAQTSASVQVGISTPIACPMYMLAACPDGYENAAGSNDLNGCWRPGPCVPKTTSSCKSGGISYPEGTKRTCIDSGSDNPLQQCIADAYYVCRSGSWKIEGGLPGPVPVGTFSASPTSGSAPLTVTFLSMVGGFLPGNISYTIDFGDGTTERAAECFAPTDKCTSAGKNTHTYAKPGTYTAKLLKNQQNTCNASDSMVCAAWVASSETLGSVTISVAGTDIGATLSASPTSGNAPLTVTFKSDRGDTIDFGDGTQEQSAYCTSTNCTTEGIGATHTYTTAGTYTARLKKMQCPSVYSASAALSLSPQPCTWTELTKVSITVSPMSGSAAVASWKSQAFSTVGASKACTGAKYVGYSQRFGVWVGAQLCGSRDQYKLYMSSSESGTYYQIADYGGHGQDHCELVNPSFTMPNDDDITSGTCKNCAIADVNDVQDETVFARQSMGQPFTQVRSGYWGELTTNWYKCGVPIGSSVSADDSSTNTANLANALTALQDALKALITKLR